MTLDSPATIAADGGYYGHHLNPLVPSHEEWGQLLAEYEQQEEERE